MSPAHSSEVRIQCHFDQALKHHQRGEITQAQALYQKILQLQPDHFDSLHLLGVSCIQTRQLEQGVQLIQAALKVNSNSFFAWNNLSKAFHDLNQYDNAIACCQKALNINPNYAEAFINIGNAFLAKERYREALSYFTKAIQLAPSMAEGHYNQGCAHLALKESDQAVQSFNHALVISPQLAEARYNLGNALRDLHRLDEAIFSYKEALRIKPHYPEALSNLADILKTLGRLEEALSHYSLAHQTRPNHAQTLYNIGNVLQELNRPTEAISFYDRAIEQDANFAAAYNNRGNTLLDLKRLDECLESYEQALRLNPEYEFLLGTYLHTKMRICDWQALPALKILLEKSIAEGKSVTPPFPVLSISEDPKIQRLAARTFANAKFPSTAYIPSRNPSSLNSRKIRLGYVSSDFREHAVTYLMSGIIRCHDRSQFEVFGIDIGHDDQSLARKRIVESFDQFIQATSMTDDEITEAIKRLEIDILIDLNGHTKGSRTGVFAKRAAPIQINYLGYPGTMGASYYDYIVADKTLVPAEYQADYSEKVIYLPCCFQANDNERPISLPKGRAFWGINPNAFVFGCFNQPSKITPEIFEIWLTLLEKVPHSVLWLLGEHPSQVANLRATAEVRSINPDRLIFASHVPYADHLSRYREIDLALDTYPFNGGTTSSDALWGGCPVLTLTGRSLASRMGSALLSPLGFNELVTDSYDMYFQTAIELSIDHTRLNRLRDQLHVARENGPVFNSIEHTRHLESAFQALLAT